MTTRKTAIYARVSTQDQSADMQLRDLRKMADARGFDLVATFIDEGESGSKTSRPQLDQMLADARRGKFQVILVWRLDRLGRSLAHLVRLLEDFKGWGVELVSYSEGLDFTTSSGKLFYQLLGAFAEFERETIRERVRAGLRNAKARGVRLGQKPTEVKAVEVQKLRDSGLGYRAIASQLGISIGTAHKLSSQEVQA